MHKTLLPFSSKCKVKILELTTYKKRNYPSTGDEEPITR